MSYLELMVQFVSLAIQSQGLPPDQEGARELARRARILADEVIEAIPEEVLDAEESGTGGGFVDSPVPIP